MIRAASTSASKAGLFIFDQIEPERNNGKITPSAS